MQLSIIIVSFNTRGLLKKCLDSLSKSLSRLRKKISYEVFVIDNASNDQSPQMVKKIFPWIKLLVNKVNKGYGAANNQALKEARGDLILFLNSDTEISEVALVNLLEKLKEDKKIGVVAPRLVYADSCLQYSCGYSPSFLKVVCWLMMIDCIPFLARIIKPYHVRYNSFYDSEQLVDWVSGACFLVRKNVLQKVGGFNEEIFMYGEEVELMYRIRAKGYLIKYLPLISVIHHKGASGQGKYAGITE